MGNDALAFLLEIAAVAALVVWGFAVGPTLLLRIVFGIGAAVVLIAVWGYWLAPRARHPLPRPGVFAGKLTVLLIAAAALWRTGHGWAQRWASWPSSISCSGGQSAAPPNRTGGRAAEMGYCSPSRHKTANFRRAVVFDPRGVS